jgi:DNA polymerase I
MNPLIYGKNTQSHIVSIEAHEDKVEIFTEKDGIISSTFEENVYWILMNKPVSENSIRLDGDLYYKYARTFRNRNEFFKFKRYLYSKNIDSYSVGDPKESIMLRNGYTYFKGMNPKDVSILSFDIETTGLTHDDNSKILCISNTFRIPIEGVPHGGVCKKLFSYDDYDSPKEMIEDWAKWIRDMNPSILTGHNIVAYDLPYINYIAEREGITLNLGRNGSALTFDKYEAKFRKDGSQSYSYHRVKIYGREVIDTLFLSIKYDATERKFESYGLKQIIKQLGLEDPNRVFYDASKIRQNYQIPEEWEKIKAYCIDDSDDSIKLWDLMSAPFFYSAQSIPKSFQAIMESATGSQINSIMVRAYLQDKHSISKGDDNESYEGATSFGVPGKYNNLFKIDLNSMYPSIIRQYKLYDKVKDPKAYFLELVEFFTLERTKNKQLYAETGNKYYNGVQSSQKIFANSCYGFLGAPKLAFNSPKIAAEITKIGREILKKSIEWATDKSVEFWLEKI